MSGGSLSRVDLLRWLREEDPIRLEELWREADRVRREAVGDEIHLRGLLEISNHCRLDCLYCGIRAGNASLPRYRMEEKETVASARRAGELGYGTVVIQSGDDPAITGPSLARAVRRIKEETAGAVTLSIGERPLEDLAAWRRAGADRYLLRFETSDRSLYERVHPAPRGRRSDRIALLGALRDLGYEVGSGVLIGLPGQSVESLADDLLLFRELDLDMIGVGPFHPHPDTPLGRGEGPAPAAEPVRNDPVTACKTIALARLLCPEANIPSTTALAALGAGERADALRRGANVFMPNVTPLPYRRLYSIYPSKAKVDESDERIHSEARSIVLSLGRRIGAGRGDRIRRKPTEKIDGPGSAERTLHRDGTGARSPGGFFPGGEGDPRPDQS
ncbi:MAG: [FeFe] hydrogenase H-cluster radical SAM maturase HydE [Candidatus Eisenbacteria bacterium]|nr:[FeFe] hydrogenase H-cluster radical SAM maturase HydE [Candidatus Eisenbacteria bacterium]